MKSIRSENGLTLIEVLVSIVILSIIITAIMNFLPQMSITTQKSNDRIQGFNSAKQYLVEWQNSDEVKVFLENPDSGLPKEVSNYVRYENDNYVQDGYYFFTTKKDRFIARIKIRKNSELSQYPSRAHQIHIQIMDDKNDENSDNDLVISEIYGYIMFESEAEEG